MYDAACDMVGKTGKNWDVWLFSVTRMHVVMTKVILKNLLSFFVGVGKLCNHASPLVHPIGRSGKLLANIEVSVPKVWVAEIAYTTQIL